MKILKLLAALLLVVNSSVVAQYAWLYVQDPRAWGGGQGTIEEASLVVSQKGIYTQNDLYLTFSARDLLFAATDSLEVQMTFTLPANAIVIDSWLLINNAWVQAGIMDRWTASTIYESIVRRRRDPSVLYKDYSNYYQLRVYPLPGTQTRKVRISYLTSNDWTAKSLVSPLPTYVVQTSRTLPSNFSVLCYPPNTTQKPYLLEMPDLAGTALTDSVGQSYYRFNIPSSSFSTVKNLVFGTRTQNGLLVTRFQNGDDGIYQIALTPWKALNINASRKVALLFDFDASRSSFTAANVLSTVRLYLSDNFTSADSINFIFSGATPHRLYSGWVGADSASIVKAFADAGSTPFSGYSNLPSLLADGIDFIQTHGDDGVAWLIANTDQVGNVQASNALLNDVMKLMPTRKIPFHICDFNVNYYTYLYVNGQGYPGNQYFYDNLARMTNGSDRRIEYSGTLSGIIALSASQLRGKIEASDVYTTLASGFCYGRIPIGSVGLQAIGLEETILQTGKFNGSFPLIIDIAGIVGDSVFSRQISVSEQDAVTVDSVAAQVWAGNYVANLESSTMTNDVIRQIIAVSLTNRVLTRYTAFLCLDPADSIVICMSCTASTNGGPTIGVQKDEPPSTASKDSLLQAFPNPFNSQTVLQVRLPAGVTGDQVSLRVYNMLGQIVYTFSTAALNDRSATRVVWNARTDHNTTVSSGVYFVMLNTPKGRFTTKLLLMK